MVFKFVHLFQIIKYIMDLLESVDLLNGGNGYDVLNPPIVGIETSSGVGAAVEPIIQGTVKEVFVDPQEFDIDAVTSISLNWW